jgi:hypothetical protein
MGRTLTVAVNVDNAALRVGCMAAKSTLIGNLLSGKAIRNDVGTINGFTSWWPDTLPGLGGWGHFVLFLNGNVK